MLSLVFAMITLQNAAPDPTVTPAASIGQRLTGQGAATGLAPGDGGFGNLTITAGCTYGAPRLGQTFFGDATDLTRTLTEPQCSDATASQPEGFLNDAPAAVLLLRPSGQTGLSAGLHDTGPTQLAIPNFSTATRSASTTYTLQHLTLPKEMTTPIGPVTAIHAQSPVRTTTVHRPQPEH